MRQLSSSVVRTVVCGALFLMPSWGAAKPSPAATPPEPVRVVREDIAWVQATMEHPPVPGDKNHPTLHISECG